MRQSLITCLFSLLSPVWAWSAHMDGMTATLSGSSVSFTLGFVAPPNFTFQQDAFHVYVIGADLDLVSVIRGTEIYLGNGLPIRNIAPASLDPIAQGWGSMRGTVPLTMTNTTLSFLVPLDVLNISAPHSFALGTFTGKESDGQLAVCAFGSASSCSVPEPSTLLPLLMGLLGVAFAWYRAA